MQPQLFTSASAEHYTPADILERIRATFGEPIDLDPASSYAANHTVKAARHYTKFDNGLNRSWAARTLWLNPPFSEDQINDDGSPRISPRTGKPIRTRVIGQWVDRWRAALGGDPDYYIHAPEVQQAALLVPARVDTQWFIPLFGMAMCFISGRVTFGDATSGAPFPTVIIYHGPHIDRFYTLFDEIGECGRLTQS